MKQFLLPSEYSGEPVISISGSDHHYIKHVRRLKKGDSFLGRDKEGRLYQLIIQAEARNTLVLRSIKKDEREDSLPSAMNLFQCLPKGNKMDLIVRQATEAGINRIVALISDHTVNRRTGKEIIESRIPRWERIAKEALQQSGASVLPRIEGPIPLAEASRGLKGCNLLFHQEPLANWGLHHCLSERPAEVNILIGPEGGFADTEIETLLKTGFQPVSMGDTVLRVETAAIAAILVVKILLLEMNSWKTC